MKKFKNATLDKKTIEYALSIKKKRFSILYETYVYPPRIYTSYYTV